MESRFSLLLPDDTATDALGDAMALALRPGDVLLLSGPVGAGKSHLARRIIRRRLGRMEDVPSPTFTLVQSYDDAGGEIWHADLYRLTHPDEVIELGLESAFHSAICLVEWPDRLGALEPSDAISVDLSAEDGGRRANIGFAGRTDLQQALARLKI